MKAKFLVSVLFAAFFAAFPGTLLAQTEVSIVALHGLPPHDAAGRPLASTAKSDQPVVLEHVTVTAKAISKGIVVEKSAGIPSG